MSLKLLLSFDTHSEETDQSANYLRYFVGNAEFDITILEELKHGNYVGQLTNDGQAHGRGTFIDELGWTYSGLF